MALPDSADGVTHQDSEPITALALSPDCKLLVAASRSLSTRCYNLITGELTRTWKVRRLAPQAKPTRQTLSPVPHDGDGMPTIVRV